MWWYGYGWWWWWAAFLIIFFLLPLGYGWGYRGWGPWYRRRGGAGRGPRRDLPPPEGQGSLPQEPFRESTGWGWGGYFLWLIILVAIIWLIVAWGWGGWLGAGHGAVHH